MGNAYVVPETFITKGYNNTENAAHALSRLVKRHVPGAVLYRRAVRVSHRKKGYEQVSRRKKEEYHRYFLYRGQEFPIRFRRLSDEKWEARVTL